MPLRPVVADLPNLRQRRGGGRNSRQASLLAWKAPCYHELWSENRPLFYLLHRTSVRTMSVNWVLVFLITVWICSIVSSRMNLDRGDHMVRVLTCSS